MSRAKVGRAVSATGIVLSLILVQPVSAQTHGTWTRKAPSPHAVAEVGVAAVEGKIYVVGGGVQSEKSGGIPVISGLNLMYDPASDSWRELAALPRALSHVAVTAWSGKLYAFGGFTRDVHIDPQSSAFVYDPKSDRWNELASLSSARGSMAVAAVAGKIHLFGGRRSDKVVKVIMPGGQELSVGEGTVTTHDIYDPATGQWAVGKALPGPPRDHMGVAVLDGKVHLFGGRINDFTDLLDRHDVYDPKTDTWASAAALPHPRSAGAYTVLRGLIVYAGGECKPGGQPGTPSVFDDVTAYDPKTDSWMTLTPLPQARQAFGAATVGDIAYFVGGAQLCGGGASSDLLALTLKPPSPTAH